MFYIFLDTNLFVSNFQFNQKSNARLLKYSKREDIQVCLTYMNYREIIKKYRDFIAPEINKIKNSNAVFKKYSGEFLVGGLQRTKFYVDKYRENLNDLIESNNILIVKHGQNFSDKIIEKYFNNEKPFDFNKPSFQDAIIWETINHFYNEKIDHSKDEIFFLTTNIKDFAKETTETGRLKYKLYDNLIEEAPNLIIYKDVEEFFSNEEDSLHEYLIDDFEIDNAKVSKLISNYLSEIAQYEIQVELEHFLSHREYEGEHFNGWGEDAYETLIKVDIIDYSKDAESGVIEIICSGLYEVQFVITTLNPLYEKDSIDEARYLHDNSGKTKVLVTCNIEMRDDVIEYFHLDSIENL